MAADACYSLTGEALWGRAKPEERLALVRAFASNSHVVCFELANSGAPDAIAEAFGDALKSNATLTSLNLESNAIGTAGVKALASGVKANTSLRELKLANQKGASATQAAEEELAAAVSSHPKLTKLTLDAKSTRARDTIEKALRANQDRARQERRTSVPKINLTSPLKVLSAKRLSRTSKTAGGEDSAPKSARKGSTIGNLLRKASLMSSSGGAASPAARARRRCSIGSAPRSRRAGRRRVARRRVGRERRERRRRRREPAEGERLLDQGPDEAAAEGRRRADAERGAVVGAVVEGERARGPAIDGATPPGSAPVSGRSAAPSTAGRRRRAGGARARQPAARGGAEEEAEEGAGR